MNRTARLAVSALAVVALAGAPAVAEAHPGHGHGHGHATHAASHGPAVRVTRALAHLDRRLAHAASERRLSHLTDADRAALEANVATDRAAVEAAGAALAADPSDANLAAARDVLHTYRPTVYVVATNLLRHSERVAAALTALTPLVTAGSTDETDLTSAAALLATVQASVFTATTDRATVHAAQQAVVAAQELVGQVADDLAAA
jgi:hypothetical protein